MQTIGNSKVSLTKDQAHEHFDLGSNWHAKIDHYACLRKANKYNAYLYIIGRRNASNNGCVTFRC